MGEFTPKIPIALQIRKIIFEKYNDTDLRFNNDEIFDIIKKNGDVDPSWTVDEMEPYFLEICDKGLTRNIAQNFTTLWFKLFDQVEKLTCPKCRQEIFLGTSEEKVCPNPICKAAI